MDRETGKKIDRLCGKAQALIAVLDSGLGGLSVCAELEGELRRHPIFRHAHLSYFNVWPEAGRGYNSMADVAERVEVFDRALESVSTAEPDMILIACNTLSVLYNRTRFSRATHIPVVDIIDYGVDMIHAELKAVPKSQVILLGTRTTISEGVHQRALVQQGIDPGRIASQDCHGVATAIEKGPHSPRVADLVATYMDEAMKKLDGRQAVFAALCCTHFGYSRDIFRHALRKRLTVDVTMLDPTLAMGRFLLRMDCNPAFDRGSVTVDVLSKIELAPAGVRQISAIIRPQAPATADALERYVYKPDLF
ncbi:MAG: aspartate/glutamate racemase family protein [Deltaproteobacteria bacterium]|nr:aspartate/glutamate racemase family protein [Deltaproteobacteria bacterium]